MVDEWIDARLSEVAADRNHAFAMGPFGSNIRAENYRDSGVPVIRGTNLGQPGEPRFRSDEYVYLSEGKADELASSSAHPNDIVFVAQGTIGKVGIIPTGTGHQRFILSQNLMKVTIDPDRADPLYVFYFFRSSLGQQEILSRVNPTGVPCISKPLTSLRGFNVRLPRNVATQQAIACILGALDDKIDLNQRMNLTLEATARAIFKSWFVDFDPVRAKAAGQQPPSLKPDLAALFPDAFEDSELGEIPRGWGVSLLGEVCELAYGKALKAEDRKPGSVAVMGSNGQVGWHDTALVPGPGVVVGRKGNPGVVTWTNDAFFPIDTTFYVVPKTSMPLTYLYDALVRLDLPRLGADSAVPGLNRNIAYMSPILVPQPEIAGVFDLYAKAICDRIGAIGRENGMLAGLRDALLPKLVSGELRVPDAERIVGRAV